MTRPDWDRDEDFGDDSGMRSVCVGIVLGLVVVALLLGVLL